MSGAFVRSVSLPPRFGRTGHPWELPLVEHLGAGLSLDAPVTFFVGENGSGKSTLVEALAVALGMNAEGGSSYLRFSTNWEEPRLGRELVVERTARRPHNDFFLRAESVFNLATLIDRRAGEGDDEALDHVGGRSLHEQSHGESFLAIALNRLGPEGLYLLDEPEAALSAQNCLALLRRMHELVADGCQFLVATHSPVLLAYPGATIYELSEDGIDPVDYDVAAPVQLTRAFLQAPERFLRPLLDD